MRPLRMRRRRRRRRSSISRPGTKRRWSAAHISARTTTVILMTTACTMAMTHGHDHAHDHEHSHDHVHARADGAAASSSSSRPESWPRTTRWRAEEPRLVRRARNPGAQSGQLARRRQDDACSNARSATSRTSSTLSWWRATRRPPTTASASAPPARRRCRSTPAPAAISKPTWSRADCEELKPAAGSVVLIENVGNLVCPALFDLGERAKVVILSVTEGDDKPLKYPHMFRAAEMMVLNKMDLLPHVEFDPERALANALRSQSVDRLDPPFGAHRRGTRRLVRLAAR